MKNAEELKVMAHKIVNEYAGRVMICPQCGIETPELHEGYCLNCCVQNQTALNAHIIQFDQWQNMTGREKDLQIKAAIGWA